MHDLLVIIVLIRIVLIRFSTRNSRYLISEFNKSECALSCISPLDKQYDILSSLETRLNTQWRSFSWIKTNNINSILHDTTPCTLQQIHTHTHCNSAVINNVLSKPWIPCVVSYIFLFGQPVPPAAWTQTGLTRFSLDQQIHDLSGWLTDGLRLV